MANDPHDNEADDRAMLRKLRDQEDTMDNDEQRDYAEDTGALHDTSEDPEGEAVIPGTYVRHGYSGDINDPERFPDDDEVVPSDLPGGRTVTRQGHRAAALQLLQYWSDSDAQDFSTPRERDQDNLAAALTQAVLALSAPAEEAPETEEGDWRQRAAEVAANVWPDPLGVWTAPQAAAAKVMKTYILSALASGPEPEGTWRRRAVEAEAALTAIGGVIRGYQNFPSEIDVVGEIERILRTSGRNAKGFTVHTGMLAHDGFMPHSHEVRPDHYSVPRERP